MWGSQSESIGGGNGYESSVSSINQGVKVKGFEQKDRSWYVTTDVPSDLLVQVGDSSFHLHKYPLITKSGKINKLIYESRESDMNKIELTDLPGGAETFEFAVKFCYGVAIEISASNISGLRCASEYLEMTEDFEEGNLILKTESFLSYVVFASWKDSILVLKSCEQLSPWAENLQIVRRCCECIAWKACTNLRAINWSYTQKPIKGSSFRLNEIKESNPQIPPDWWFEDVSIFRIDHFVRIITAVKVKGMKFELIGAAIMKYAEKWLSGLMKEEINEGRNSTHDSNTNGVSSWKGGLHMIVAGNKEETLDDQVHERMIIESLVSLIPQQKDSVSCNFLLRILRMANKLKVAPALVTELEKRVGMQLEQAELADLIVPSYNKSETLYDVDLVQRLLEHFLVQEQIEDPSSPSTQSFSETARCKGTNAKMKVARLLDSYLSEVSRDKNFSMMKFQVLAEALPESARTCDDGLYRAVDSYLKAHPTLSEHDRKRLCRVMDCQKLSIDACMHAAQNERLPLRVAVQVLLSQQVKISTAISKASTNEPQYQATISPVKTFIEDIPLLFQEGLETTKKDINSLKFELESVKAKYLELQNDLENLQSHFEKTAKHKPSSAWTSGWRKLGRLTKLTTIETQDTASPSTRADQNKKSRRWRNSIS